MQTTTEIKKQIIHTIKAPIKSPAIFLLFLLGKSLKIHTKIANSSPNIINVTTNFCAILYLFLFKTPSSQSAKISFIII